MGHFDIFANPYFTPILCASCTFVHTISINQENEDTKAKLTMG